VVGTMEIQAMVGQAVRRKKGHALVRVQAKALCRGGPYSG